MKQLKKLTCGSNLCNILGKSYEQNIIDFILLTCEDARSKGNDRIEYHFYYNGTTTEKQLQKFMDNFKQYEQYVKAHRKHDYVSRNSWFLILTPEDCDAFSSSRAIHTVTDLNEHTLMRAFIAFYSMAKQQLQMSSKQNTR